MENNKAKLSQLFNETICKWENNDFREIEPEIGNFKFYNILGNKEVIDKMGILLDNRKSNKINDMELLYDLIPILCDIDMDLSVDDFIKKGTSISSTFLKFENLIQKQINKIEVQIEKMVNENKKLKEALDKFDKEKQKLNK